MLWIKTLPRVKWVPTFNVDYRRLGYVDDLRRQTHRRCCDTRMINVVSSKWICKIRYVADRSKVRVVARGFYQKEGINYEETLNPGSKVHFLQNYHGSFFHGEVKTSLP